jgi:hypothetical protein
MEFGKILMISFLIVIWWIGSWGIVETLIHQYIRGSTTKALWVYGSMIVFVITVVYFNPHVIDHFI